jgi:adhesin transport system outer membrane protein
VAAGLEFTRLTNWIPQRVRVPQLTDVGVAVVPEKLETAVSLAMTNNPEVASLILEMKAADLDKSVGKGLFLPKFNVEFSDTYSNHAGGAVDAFNSCATQRDQRLMVVMNWSIISGGSDYNFYKEREAKYRELQYRLDDQRRRTTQNLSTNYGVLANTKERLAVGYNELKSISIAAEAMSKRMLSGNQSLLDLLDVYDRYYQARVRLVNLHIQEMSTVAQTVRYLQSYPSEADLRISRLNQTVIPEKSATSGAASVKDNTALSKKNSSSSSPDAGNQNDKRKEGLGVNAR